MRVESVAAGRGGVESIFDAWRRRGFWNALLIAAIVGQATASLRSARADQDLSAARVKESIRRPRVS